VTLGVLIEFVAVLAIPLIGAFMFPVLRRYHEALALAYVGFRSLEALLLIAIEAKLLSLIDLSNDHLNTPGTDASQLQAMGDSLLSEKDQIFVSTSSCSASAPSSSTPRCTARDWSHDGSRGGGSPPRPG